MAEEETETREPDAAEEAASTSAGGQEEATPGLEFEDTQMPNFEEMNKNIKETRKPAGPAFDDPNPDAETLQTDEEEDIGPTDPS